MTEFAATPVIHVELPDHTLHVNQLEYCTLCIEIDKYYFRFCIVENISSQCRWMESYQFSSPQTREDLLDNIKKIIGQHPLLGESSWGNIVVSFNSYAFTYVPAPLFRTDHSEEYLRIMLPDSLHPDDSVLEDKLRIIDGHAVFSAPTSIVNWFTEYYPDKTIRFCHHSQPLIYATIKDNYLTINRQRTSILTDNNRVTIVVVEGSKFIFCNSFQYSNSQELTYLILFVLNQLNTDPKDANLILNGDITVGSEDHTELSRFFSNVEMGKKPQSLSYNHRINEMDTPGYTRLLNTYFMVY